jgi:pimeloyl-ACP methyl ester carboxylesterase
MVEGVSRWRSVRAARRFEGLYADASADVLRELVQAGLPAAEVSDVPGRFGTTRCLRWRGAGEPVVLLHGQNASWLSWAPLVGRLVGRDLVALDTIGEPGGSRQREPVESVDALAGWVEETLDALGVARPAVAGMSYGGWIAAHFAAAHPDRVRSLILLEPAIGDVTKGRVIRHGMLVGLTQLLPPPARRRAARRLDAEPLVFDARLRKPTALAFRRFDRRIPTYAELDEPTPDGVLSAITAPTLLVLGGNSELHDVAAVGERARRLIPDLELHVVDGASHALPVTRPGAVVDLVIPFLDRTAHRHPAGEQID